MRDAYLTVWLAWACVAFAFAPCRASWAAPPVAPPDNAAQLALDHMPLVVGDLDAASRSYATLGFALKPGRPHDNGLRNMHVKFPDGSGIELLSPERGPADALAAQYHGALATGEGPVFFALRAHDAARLESALNEAGIAFHREAGAWILDTPALSFLFFGGDNRSPTDRPEHFAHANSAVAMSGVWIALDADAAQRLSRLLVALGAERGRDVLPLGKGVEAEVLKLSNGRIALLPVAWRTHPQRPLVGVEFQVRDRARVPGCADAPKAALQRPAGSARTCLMPPARTHGLWVEFTER